MGEERGECSLTKGVVGHQPLCFYIDLVDPAVDQCAASIPGWNPQNPQKVPNMYYCE